MTPEEEHHKEVYAQLGVAVYWAQCLETTLGNILLFDAVLNGNAPTAQELDALEAKLVKKCLGHLLGDVRAKMNFPAMAEQLFEEALNKRNFLIHHFFRERSFEWETTKGRDRMVAELKEAQAFLRAADKAATELSNAQANLAGITAERLAEEAERMREEVRKADKVGG